MIKEKSARIVIVSQHNYLFVNVEPFDVALGRHLKEMATSLHANDMNAHLKMHVSIDGKSDKEMVCSNVSLHQADSIVKSYSKSLPLLFPLILHAFCALGHCITRNNSVFYVIYYDIILLGHLSACVLILATIFRLMAFWTECDTVSRSQISIANKSAYTLTYFSNINYNLCASRL